MKMKLYIGLLALGIALIGSGVWLVFGSTQARFSLPEGNPIIYKELEYIMRGEGDYLYIYDDGSVVYIEGKGLRFPSEENPATRTWKSGSLTADELDGLLEYLDNSGFEQMEGFYPFPGRPAEGGGSIERGDLVLTVTVVSGSLNKSVTASGYLTPDRGETYPDMPAPLNEIYVKLRAITQATEEVAHENIS
jgi:hypothetical protein